jgi:hypothetical protein
MNELMHQHDCQDDDAIIAKATDIALARAASEGKKMPTSGRPPAWLLRFIDEAIEEVLAS